MQSYNAPTQKIHLPRNPEKPRRVLMPWLIGGGLVFGWVALMCLVGLGVYLLAGGGTSGKIAQGVTVGGVPLGGLSPEEARQTLQTTPPHAALTLTDGERVFPVRLADLGVTVDVETTLKAAQAAAPNSALEPRYSVDLNQTITHLTAMSETINIPAAPGNPPQIGRALDVPVMVDRLRADVTGELADDVLELSMFEVAPPPQEAPNRSQTETTVHRVQAGQELALIARQYGVTVDDILAYNDLADPDILLIGQELVIPAAGLYAPEAGEAPAPPTTSGKAIVVSTGDQRIYAYENGVLVHSTLVSTGLPDTPTVLGDYAIYIKYEVTSMSGPGYYIPRVPYTMYFFQGYGIHAADWHNSFGRPMSHGCVNLPLGEAEWFFRWAEVGTPVRVV